MLPKNRRIKKQLFPLVLSGGKRLYSTHFLLYVKKTDKNEPSLFAFSVSKKVCKKAVDRNRLRRQGYAAVSRHIKKIPAGYLFVFSFKKGPYPISFDEMEKEILSVILPNKF